MAYLLDNSKEMGDTPANRVEEEVRLLAKYFKKTAKNIKEVRRQYPSTPDIDSLDCMLAEAWPFVGMQIADMIDLEHILLRAVAFVQRETQLHLDEIKEKQRQAV